MDLGLAGKCSIVTAASKGIGRAVAQRLSQEKVTLAICARGEKELRETAGDITEAGGKVFFAPADLSAPSDISQFVDWAATKLAGIDILVTSAGGPRPGKFTDLSDKDWQHAFDLSFMSVQRLCREVIPYMQRQGGGRIINLSSLSVRQPLEGLISSNSLRLGALGLAKTLSDELAGDGITVNTVCPGFTLTDRLKDYMANIAKRDNKSVDDVMAGLTSKIPMGRLAEPQDIADVVAFLASEKAAYLTGLCISVDGGASRPY